MDSPVHIRCPSSSEASGLKPTRDLRTFVWLGGIAYTALDNGFLTCADPQALREICDSLGPQQIEAFLARWLERLPMPLTREDRAAGYTLFCQAKPSSDMLIESHEIRMATDIQIRKMPSRVVGLEKVRDDVMVVRLQMPSSEPFRYYPGQYLEFILKDGSRRSYSMATPPREDNQVELHIRHMPGGVFTDHVFGAGATAMKEREILRVEAPLGSFFLREDSAAPMVFLASGTGFAPIKALIERGINFEFFLRAFKTGSNELNVLQVHS